MLMHIKLRVWLPAATFLQTKHNLVSRIARRANTSKMVLSRLGRKVHFKILTRRRTPVSLFLVPEAGLQPYYASHVILARSVMHADGRALVMSCKGILPVCSVKAAMGVGATPSGNTANSACKRCLSQALMTGHEHGLHDVSIESLIPKSRHNAIDAILARHADNIWGTKHDDIDFGALAAGETMRWNRRSSRYELSEVDVSLGKALLHAALLIYFAVNELNSKYNITRLSFMGDYSYWLPLQLFAERNHIGVTTIDHGYHKDIDRRMLCLRTGSANLYFRDQVNNWRYHARTPVTTPVIESILDGALFRLAAAMGVSIHSPVWERLGNSIKDRLGLSHTRKTIVAYSSSMDEFVAANELFGALGRSYGVAPRPFPDQVSWMRALCTWVQAREDLQLVIRLHPRIAAGARFSQAANEYSLLKEVFKEVPPNVLVVWPEEKISSYNLAEVADAVLVGWSTIGLELARFGVPVISAFQDICPFPVGSFVGFYAEPVAYFSAIEEAMLAPASLDHMTEAFRWTHYAFWSVSTDIGDLVPIANYEGVPSWRVPKNIDALHNVYMDGRDLSEINMNRMASTSSFAAERETMKRVIERLLIYFLTSRDGGECNIKGIQHLDGKTVSAEINNETFWGDTRMIIRLAELFSRSFG